MSKALVHQFKFGARGGRQAASPERGEVKVNLRPLRTSYYLKLKVQSYIILNCLRSIPIDPGFNDLQILVLKI